MTCQQCGADLMESATFCYKCGTPVRSAAFSYIPAGAPPWPATVPPLARSQNVAPPSQAPEKGSARQARQGGRSRGGIIAIIALLILTPVLGAGITLGVLYANGQFPPHAAPKTSGNIPASQPTLAANTPVPSSSTTPSQQGNTLPAPTSFQTASNTQINVSIKYPSDWQAIPLQTTTSGNASIGFRSQQVPVELDIGRISAANSSGISDPGVVNQANIQGFSNNVNGTNLQVLSNTPQQLKVGGITWAEQDANFTVNNVVYHMVSLSVKHGQTYYNIVYYSPDQSYQEAVQKYFQPMLGSFQFLT